MPQIPLPLVQVIHENLSTVMTFAFSRTALEEWTESNFLGEWKPLRRALFDIPESRAIRAMIELATFLRFLDDEEHLGNYLKGAQQPAFGRLEPDGQPEEDLYLRDLTNKVIHARELRWDFKSPGRPMLICLSDSRWRRAEIDLKLLARFCGMLM
jgi:hypothetical protein